MLSRILQSLFFEGALRCSAHGIQLGLRFSGEISGDLH